MEDPKKTYKLYLYDNLNNNYDFLSEEEATLKELNKILENYFLLHQKLEQKITICENGKITTLIFLKEF